MFRIGQYQSTPCTQCICVNICSFICTFDTYAHLMSDTLRLLLKYYFAWMTFTFAKVIFEQDIFAFTQVWLLGSTLTAVFPPCSIAYRKYLQTKSNCNNAFSWKLKDKIFKKWFCVTITCQHFLRQRHNMLGSICICMCSTATYADKWDQRWQDVAAEERGLNGREGQQILWLLNLVIQIAGRPAHKHTSQQSHKMHFQANHDFICCLTLLFSPPHSKWTTLRAGCKQCLESTDCESLFFFSFNILMVSASQTWGFASFLCLISV